MKGNGHEPEPTYIFDGTKAEAVAFAKGWNAAIEYAAHYVQGHMSSAQVHAIAESMREISKIAEPE